MRSISLVLGLSSLLLAQAASAQSCFFGATSGTDDPVKLAQVRAGQQSGARLVREGLGALPKPVQRLIDAALSSGARLQPAPHSGDWNYAALRTADTSLGTQPQVRLTYQGRDRKGRFVDRSVSQYGTGDTARYTVGTLVIDPATAPRRSLVAGDNKLLVGQRIHVTCERAGQNWRLTSYRGEEARDLASGSGGGRAATRVSSVLLDRAGKIIGRE